MARSSLLTAGFLLTGFFLSGAAALPAGAAVTEDQPMAPTPVATAAPTPLQEPHAVDQAPLPPLPHAVPAKPRRPAAARSSAKPAQARPQAAAKAKTKPLTAEQTVRPKARPAPPRIAAKPAVPSHPQVGVKPKSTPPRLARPAPRHMLAQAPRRPMVRRNFGYRIPEARPHSGLVYDTPAGVPSSPAPAYGCDEACQYRDWLNRYAAWYRDFGRYYYGAPERPMAPGHPAPPMTYGENRAAPPPAYRPDQSERDRLDPWHGYNPHSPSNGY